MPEGSRSRLAPLFENVAESTAACLLTMVQGSLWLVSLAHWGIALQTGVLAGGLTALVVLLAHPGRRWVVSLLLGAATAVVDYQVHPGSFGAFWTEAAVTGLAAAALSYGVGALLARLRAGASGSG